MITPTSIAKNDFFLSISSTDAINDPVHAPVPGSGIPTNNTNPKYPNFSICPFLFSTFLSSQSAIFLLFLPHPLYLK